MTTTEDFTLLDDVYVSSHYMWALFLVNNELLPTVCCHLQQHLKSVVPFWTWGVTSSLHVSSRTLLQLPNTELKEDTSLIPGWEKNEDICQYHVQFQEAVEIRHMVLFMIIWKDSVSEDTRTASCQCGTRRDDAGSEAHHNPSQKTQISGAGYLQELFHMDLNSHVKLCKGPSTTLTWRCWRQLSFPEEGKYYPSTLGLILEKKDTALLYIPIILVTA